MEHDGQIKLSARENKCRRMYKMACGRHFLYPFLSSALSTTCFCPEGFVCIADISPQLIFLFFPPFTLDQNTVSSPLQWSSNAWWLISANWRFVYWQDSTAKCERSGKRTYHWKRGQPFSQNNKNTLIDRILYNGVCWRKKEQDLYKTYISFSIISASSRLSFPLQTLDHTLPVHPHPSIIFRHAFILHLIEESEVSERNQKAGCISCANF